MCAEGSNVSMILSQQCSQLFVTSIWTLGAEAPRLILQFNVN